MQEWRNLMKAKEDLAIFDDELALADAYYQGEDPRQGLAKVESYAGWNTLLDCAEARAALGDVEAAEWLVSLSMKASKREGAVMEAEAGGRASLLLSLMGKPALDVANQSVERLQKAMDRSSDLTELAFLEDATRGMAGCFADAAAFGNLELKEPLWQLLELIRREQWDESDDLMGLIARKLALRNEAQATSKQCVELSEQVYKNINNRLERFFTAVQIGVAKGLLGDKEQAREWFVRDLPHPEETMLLHMGILMRAGAQIGMPGTDHLLSEIKRGFASLETHYEKSWEEFEGTKITGRGWYLKERLDKNKKAAEELAFLETELQSTAHNLILAGGFAKNAGYLAEAENMMKKIRNPQARFSLEIALAEAETSLGGISTNAAQARFSGLLADYPEMLKKDAGMVEELTNACARSFAYTNDEAFAALVHAVLSSPELRLRQVQRTDLVLDCLNLARSIKMDERWGVTFFRF